jgi:hypothetical protein
VLDIKIKNREDIERLKKENTDVNIQVVSECIAYKNGEEVLPENNTISFDSLIVNCSLYAFDPKEHHGFKILDIYLEPNHKDLKIAFKDLIKYHQEFGDDETPPRFLGQFLDSKNSKEFVMNLKMTTD